MDEPLSNIDAKLRVEMRAEISKLQRRLAVTRRSLEDVWVGVRPEHLKLHRDTATTAGNLIRSVVEVVEPQGSTTIMQLSVGKEIRLIAQFNEQLDREPGTLLILSVAPESIYLFDPATDESIR